MDKIKVGDYVPKEPARVVSAALGKIQVGDKSYTVVPRDAKGNKLSGVNLEAYTTRVVKMLNESGVEELPDLSRVKVTREGLRVQESGVLAFFKRMFGFGKTQDVVPKNIERFQRSLEKAAKGKDAVVYNTTVTDEQRRALILHKEFKRGYAEGDRPKVDPEGTVRLTRAQWKEAVHLARAAFPGLDIMPAKAELVRLVVVGDSALGKAMPVDGKCFVLLERGIGEPVVAAAVPVPGQIQGVKVYAFGELEGVGKELDNKERQKALEAAQEFDRSFPVGAENPGDARALYAPNRGVMIAELKYLIEAIKLARQKFPNFDQMEEAHASHLLQIILNGVDVVQKNLFTDIPVPTTTPCFKIGGIPVSFREVEAIARLNPLAKPEDVEFIVQHFQVTKRHQQFREMHKGAVPPMINQSQGTVTASRAQMDSAVALAKSVPGFDGLDEANQTRLILYVMLGPSSLYSLRPQNGLIFALRDVSTKLGEIKVDDGQTALSHTLMHIKDEGDSKPSRLDAKTLLNEAFSLFCVDLSRLGGCTLDFYGAEVDLGHGAVMANLPQLKQAYLAYLKANHPKRVGEVIANNKKSPLLRMLSVDAHEDLSDSSFPEELLKRLLGDKNPEIRNQLLQACQLTPEEIQELCDVGIAPRDIEPLMRIKLLEMIIFINQASSSDFMDGVHKLCPQPYTVGQNNGMKKFVFRENRVEVLDSREINKVTVTEETVPSVRPTITKTYPDLYSSTPAEIMLTDTLFSWKADVAWLDNFAAAGKAKVTIAADALMAKHTEFSRAHRNDKTKPSIDATTGIVTTTYLQLESAVKSAKTIPGFGALHEGEQAHLIRIVMLGNEAKKLPPPKDGVCFKLHEIDRLPKPTEQEPIPADRTVVQHYTDKYTMKLAEAAFQFAKDFCDRGSNYFVVSQGQTVSGALPSEGPSEKINQLKNMYLGYLLVNPHAVAGHVAKLDRQRQLSSDALKQLSNGPIWAKVVDAATLTPQEKQKAIDAGLDPDEVQTLVYNKLLDLVVLVNQTAPASTEFANVTRRGINTQFKGGIKQLENWRMHFFEFDPSMENLTYRQQVLERFSDEDTTPMWRYQSTNRYHNIRGSEAVEMTHIDAPVFNFRIVGSQVDVNGKPTPILEIISKTF